MCFILFLIVLIVKANDVGDCCSGHENTIDGCDQCPYGYEPTTASNACFWLSLVPFSDWGWKCRGLLSSVDQTALEDLLISVYLAQLPTLKRTYEREGTGANDFVNRVTDLAQLGYLLETPISSENYISIDMGDYPSQVISWYDATHDGNKQLVITFHGSSEAEDYVQTNLPAVLNIGGSKCLDFSGTSYCGPEPVIEDYERSRSQLQNEIFSILDDSCNENCISTIRVTGHSLRGAIAAYFALELIERYGSIYNVWLSTFASIKALTDSSSDHAHDVFSSGDHRHFRYAVNGDIVPRFPSSSKHFGDAFFIDDGHLMSKSRDFVPDDHDTTECASSLGIECLVAHHAMVDYIAGAALTKEYYFNDDRIEYTGSTKTCPCDPAQTSGSVSFQLRGTSGDEKVTIYSGVTSETVSLSTNWEDLIATENSLIISFLNDGSGRDVQFQSDVAASVRSDAMWPGWNCETTNEDSRCDSVRSGNFNWSSDYQIVFEENVDTFQAIYTSSKRTCHNSQKLSQPCNAGKGSPCTESACQQHCIDNTSCTHAFAIANGGCIIYSGCTSTRTAGNSGTTYSLNRVSVGRRELTSRLLKQ